MNQCILYGHLGGDPEIRHLDSGKSVTNFTLATNTGREEPDWHRIVCWDRLAETTAEFLSKGSGCLIQGELRTRKWEDKEGGIRYVTEVHARSVSFTDPRNAADERERSGGSSRKKEERPPDDVPF